MISSKKLRTIVRFLVLALLLPEAGTAVFVRAQESAPSPPQYQQDGDEVRQAGGPGHQLAHESREAAGEEKDNMDEFKHSASVGFVSRITGLSLKNSYWLGMLTNFAVVVGLFVWAGRKYLPSIFRNRTEGIQRAMQEAQKASEEARQKLAEIESRLMKLDVEIGKMRETAEKEGAAEVVRIQAAAEEDARKIIASAEQEISAAGKAARRQLTAYAADLAVTLAKKQIHVDAGTDQALVRNFAGQLGAVPEAGKDGN
ncbi:MAG: ATP synthase F0 subunit B [Candidatus Sulfotelmatobacter sp.]